LQRHDGTWHTAKSPNPKLGGLGNTKRYGVADVFGSLFAFAAGLLVMRSGVLPRWLGWVSIIVGVLFFLQAFGLGGVIAVFGLVLDLVGFVLFLIFVLAPHAFGPPRSMKMGGRSRS
jgi:hypothetical protein